MNKTKHTTCKLLALTRKAYQRHTMIATHLGEHFGIDYSVFVEDPLLTAACDMLAEVIQDTRLLIWWLEHDPDDCFYSEKGKLGGVEIRTAHQLWNYYQEKQKQER